MARGGWRRSFAGERQAIETVLANGLTALFVFAASVVMARALGPEGRGRAAVHLVGIGMSIALGSLGISYAAAYAAARSGRARSAFRAVWSLGLGSIAVTAVLAFALEVVVARNAPASEKAWAIAGAVVGQAAGIAMGWIQGSRAMRAWNLLRVSPFALHLAFLLALLPGRGLTVERCIAAYAVAHALALAAGGLLARVAKTAEDPAVAFSTRDTWMFARGIAVSAALYQLNQRLDQLYLGFLGRASDLGVYASAVTIAGLGLPLASGLAQATYAEGLHASGLERGRLASRRNLAALAATGACAVVLTVLARPLMVLLYGEPFARGAPALALLSWATVFLAGNYVAAEALRSAGRSSATIRADSIAVGVSLVLLPFGIYWFGLLGAAAVSLVSYGVGYTLNLRARMRLDAAEKLASGN